MFVRELNPVQRFVSWHALMLVFVLCLPLECFANDLGVVGKTFPIRESDFLKVLQRRVLQLAHTGYLRRLQTAMRNQTYQIANRPTPVAGITRTETIRTWNYDPSITMVQDIRAPDGSLIVKAGTRYNPLNKITFDETLIFYNADDLSQVIWAEKLDQKLKGHDKLILVNGSVLSQLHLLKKPVYFDQLGRLTTRFNIKHVPATVAQEGLRLKVREVVP